MKYIKALGPAFLLASAIVILGASSASAAQICAVGVFGDEKCATTSNEAETDAPIEATSTNSVLTTNVATVTCEHSATVLDPNSSTGTPITGSVAALSFTGNCKTNGGTACTVTVVNIPYQASLETGALTVTDPTGAGATVKCGFLINCTFTSKKVELGMFASGNDTVIEASNVELARSGPFCPQTSQWNADYIAKNITVN